MKINSQICTTKEQSERLLALGLKKETADMFYTNASLPFEKDKFHLECKEFAQLEKEVNYQICPFTFIPAWSLHRLMSLCPETLPYEGDELRDMYSPDEYELQISQTGCQYLADNARYGGERLNYFYEDGNLYDALISCIEWVIKEGKFNQDFLVK